MVCLLTDRIDQDLLDAAPDLRFVSSMSVGVDHIDVPAMSARGIAVGSYAGYCWWTPRPTLHSPSCWRRRRVAEADRFVRDGNWTAANAWSPEFFTGKDVSGATLGIVGLGAIGQAVARRATGFGMEVLAWSRTPRRVTGIEMVGLEELLLRSDFVSVHVARHPRLAIYSMSTESG